MIQRLENTGRLDKSVIERLGRSLSEAHNSFTNGIGSCLYNLREIKFKDENSKIQIDQNARCNFELFEKGLLLRINDKQNFYVLSLSKEDKMKIQITEGEEKIFPINLTGFLFTIGINRDFLKKYWLLSGGFYNERFTLLIQTDNEMILLDSQGSNYKKALKYFEKSELRTKITTHNTR